MRGKEKPKMKKKKGNPKLMEKSGQGRGTQGEVKEKKMAKGKQNRHRSER